MTHQEATVQQLHNIRRQMEEIFEKEKGLLQIQVEQDAQTIQQLEVRLDVARRTIQDAREAQTTAEKEWSQVIALYVNNYLICTLFHNTLFRFFNNLYFTR